MPLAAVTNAETAQVAQVLHTGMPIHLIDDDGVPLINAHGTAMTETDRQLAAGGTHQASSLTDPVQHPNPFETLESRLTTAWDRMDGPPARTGSNAPAPTAVKSRSSGPS